MGHNGDKERPSFNPDWRDQHEAQESAPAAEPAEDGSKVKRLQDRLLGGPNGGLSSGQILGNLPPVNVDQIPEVFRRSLWEPDKAPESQPSAPHSAPGQSLHRSPVQEPEESVQEEAVAEVVEPPVEEPEPPIIEPVAEDEVLPVEDEPEVLVLQVEEEPEPEAEEIAVEVSAPPVEDEPEAEAEEVAAEIFVSPSEPEPEPEVEVEPEAEAEAEAKEVVAEIFVSPTEFESEPEVEVEPEAEVEEVAASSVEPESVEEPAASFEEEEVWVPPTVERPAAPAPPPVIAWTDFDDEPEPAAEPEAEHHALNMAPAAHVDEEVSEEPVPQFDVKVLFSSDPMDELDDEEDAQSAPTPEDLKANGWGSVPSVFLKSPLAPEAFRAPEVEPEPESVAAFEEPEVLISGDPAPAEEIPAPIIDEEPEAAEAVAEPEVEEVAAEVSAPPIEVEEAVAEVVAEPEPETEPEPEEEEILVPPVMEEPVAEVEEPVMVEETLEEPEPEQPAAAQEEEPEVPEVFRSAHLQMEEPTPPPAEPAILFAAPDEDEEPIHDINPEIVAKTPDEKASHIGAPKLAKTYRWRRLGQLLQELGLVTEAQIQEALDEQKVSRKPFGQILVELGTISEKTLLQALASQIDVEVWYMDEQEADRSVVHQLDEAFCRKHQVIALMKDGNEIVLGMKNPADLDAIEMVRRRTNSRVRPVLVDEGKLSNALDEYFSPIEKLKAQAAPDEDGDRDEEAEAMRRAAAELEEEESYPIVETVDAVILDAIKMKASDIHFEPRESMLEVRYRLDGQLLRVREFPRDILPMIIARIKIMAEVDLVEWRIPQDGRISVDLDTRTVDMRVSILPSLYGQRIVMRVLDKSAAMLGLDQLGFSKHNLTLFRRLIRRPYGLFLVTGPTGSGKTTTLYAALNEVRSSSNNVMTCEDPVEYDIDGINQSQVNEKVGLTFAQQLRAILRQDPDIVLVGEIRDHETAETAIKASMTGHMVFSTLHCNDAPGALPRLYDMNLDASNLSTSLIGVMGQRLLRKLCTHCKEEYTPDEEEQELLRNSFGSTKVKKLHRAKGCSRCHGTGYKGRMAVHEILPVTHEIAALIQERRPVEEIRTTARYYGYRTMQEDTLDRLLAGQTSLKEAQRLLAFDDIPRLDDPEKYYRDLQKQAS